nr:alpha-1,2-mannosyltransferase mnn21 [Quercus suber]
MLRRSSNKASILAAICVFVIFMLLTRREDLSSPVVNGRLNRFRSAIQSLHETTWLDQQRLFWRRFYRDLESHRPQTFPLLHLKAPQLNVPYDRSVSRTRPELLKMWPEQQAALTKAHKSFIDKITARHYPLLYRSGTRGIVMTASRRYMNVILVSIRMLRRTGSRLPIEVFIADWSDFDADICGAIMPALGAECIVLDDIFDNKSGRKVDIKKYQFKVMAILFSSFEDILFLDSDCFPVSDPERLFDVAPFTDTGLVLWPDFWFASESPLFFEIADIQAPDIRKNPTTESGQMMYSKSKHELGLLLAVYYNYHGPDFYYSLQSQGAPGEGDKETYLWSAIATNGSFYTVKQPVKPLGYYTREGEWRGSAMVQFDPEQDLASTLRSEDLKARDDRQERVVVPYPRPIFLHVNTPKIDPGQIFIPPDYKSFGRITPVFDSDGSVRRIWQESAEQAVDFFGTDIEDDMWDEVKAIACQYEHVLTSWRDKQDICLNATLYHDAVFSHDWKIHGQDHDHDQAHDSNGGFTPSTDDTQHTEDINVGSSANVDIDDEERRRQDAWMHYWNSLAEAQSADGGHK